MRLGLGWLTAVILATALPAWAQPGNRMLSRDNLSQVSAHAWTIKGSPNIGIVLGSFATLVIDNGLGSKNGKIVSDIAMSLSPSTNKLYLTTTHYHAEHATGDGGFPPGTVLVRPRVQQAELEAEGQALIDLFSSRSEQDRELLKDYRYLKPDILFDSDYRLDLGGVAVRLMWLGAAHTKGDELIFVEPDSVLFSGDVVQNKTGPFFYCGECTPKSWLAVVDKVAALNPKIVVPDHTPPGDASLIAQERGLMVDIQSRAMVLKAEGKSAEEAGKIVAAELQKKYAGWTGMARIAAAVEKAYADPS